MKKPLDILGFQGDQKGTLERKGLKEVSKTIHWKIIWERIKDNKWTSFKTKQNNMTNRIPPVVKRIGALLKLSKIIEKSWDVLKIDKNWNFYLKTSQ